MLVGEGLLAHKGQIVDASFVKSPKQHNHRKENKEIKSGKTPEEWSTSKKHQKDTDARWTMKASERHFGYKNHLKSKLITNY
ncbi:hypothetical protein FACS1894193_08790 [Bacilli bacterium]|nr:hypothetical protein FACS1894193_08790 [Bacilli bacterium]GHU46155.1 hypothetical protein FACS1894194_3350 [Bacilli bacterium]